jgi:hypothetical protein
MYICGHVCKYVGMYAHLWVCMHICGHVFTYFSGMHFCAVRVCCGLSVMHACIKYIDKYIHALYVCGHHVRVWRVCMILIYVLNHTWYVCVCVCVCTYIHMIHVFHDTWYTCFFACMSFTHHAADSCIRMHIHTHLEKQKQASFKRHIYTHKFFWIHVLAMTVSDFAQALQWLYEMYAILTRTHLEQSLLEAKTGGKTTHVWWNDAMHSRNMSEWIVVMVRPDLSSLSHALLGCSPALHHFYVVRIMVRWL